MTNTEKEIIKDSIQKIMDTPGNSDFNKGVSQLARLVGLIYPAGEVKTIDLCKCTSKYRYYDRGKKMHLCSVCNGQKVYK